jgi:ribonuclease Y
MEYVLVAVVAAVVAGTVVFLTQAGRRDGRAAPDGRRPPGDGSAAPAGIPGRDQDSSAAGPEVADSQPELTLESTNGSPPAALRRDAVEGRSGRTTSAPAPAEPDDDAPAHAGAVQSERARPAAAEVPGAAAVPEAPAGAAAPPTRSAPAAGDDVALELRERRAEIARTEERLLTREQGLEARLHDAGRREQSLEDRARNLTRDAERLKDAKHEHVRELERVASLSAGQAKQILLHEVEDELKHERARMIRQAEQEAKRDAERRARSILAACMQRLASGHAAETTVSVVPLQSDELKGRIIGREGRNIRALETLTGIDFIIDDTPGVVALSGFDGVRREIARLTLERLLQDGRIHPAKIEEAYEQSRAEIDTRITEAGEQAVFDTGIGALEPELVKLLGRLHYRTSYGQNVLAHSVECARLASMIGDELGAGAKTARRAALLHDIGKAVTHEVEGPHALVGGQLARRHKESEAVAHAMEAHHNEVDVQTIEAVVVQIADSLSGARPGARGESLETYTKRLRDIEEIASRRPGVERVYAMQAGREVRVIVRPEAVDDDTAAILSYEIARELERELEYAGQIKVTVIRESRAVNYAK